MLWPGQGVYQGHRTHSWLSLLPFKALSLLIWLTGPLHSLTLLREEWLWSGCSSSAPPSAPSNVPRAPPSLPAASPPWVGEHCPGTLPWHLCTCALWRGGFAFALCSLHATRVPSPQHRPWAALGLWASGPRAALKQTPTNCNKEKDKWVKGLVSTEGFHILFMAVTQ